ncbi:hypothetical protein Tco_1091630 [Tanacetum coccineum]|uniref:Uncharacterized protein n=1 Tax=Tanacetum coccineum TaxID=301880 RepID=A0ABQ5I9X6_9ASTR
MKLYIRGKEHGKDLIDSVLNGAFQYGTVVEDGIPRTKIYEKLTDKEKIREECDIRANNIVLQGLLPDVYNIVNHHIQLSPIAQQLYNSHQQPLSYEALAHQQSYHSLAIHQTSMIPQQAYQSPTVQQQPQAMFPQLDSGLDVPSFLLSDDPIASINKAMTFMSTSITLRYPSTNNQLRTSSNPRNQATIQDGRLDFLADPRVAQGLETQTTLPINAAFQTDDLDTFDSDCDEAPFARAVLMANLSIYDSDVLSEVPISENSQDNYVLDQCVQEMY